VDAPSRGAATARPLPPFELALRVGHRRGHTHDDYLTVGRRLHDAILAALPEGFSLEGKRALDFGCGAGRTLRHFLDVADRAEIWGCDIDRQSIAWLEANLCPPLRCFRNGTSPPLDVEDGYFDVVWAMSVFTHIDEGWAEWLLELHRVLAPNGVLVASYMGSVPFERLLDEPYVEDEVGMLVRNHWRRLEDGGAWVFHSRWWLHVHWGRAFDIQEVRPGVDGGGGVAHSILVARPRPTAPSAEALRRIEPDERRELAGLETQVRMLRGELSAAAGSGPRGGRARRALLDSPLGEPARRLRRRMVRLRGR
jgi:SAM-dependent methyltransferase